MIGPLGVNGLLVLRVVEMALDLEGGRYPQLLNMVARNVLEIKRPEHFVIYENVQV